MTAFATTRNPAHLRTLNGLAPRGPRQRAGCLALLALSALAAGCGGIEWNWQSNWWNEPRRTVRPSPTRPGESRPAGANRSDTTDPPNDAKPGAAMASPPLPAGDAAPTAVASPDRAYYQLYLISGEIPDEALRGEHRQPLRNVSARTCASVLELLYVPIGRSGSENECYLLYEDREEFQAAAAFAALLDVAPSPKPTTAEDEPEAFSSGLALYYWLIQQGAVVERPVVSSAESQLGQVARSKNLATNLRWASAILAARLASEYRYDYSAAAGYASEARRLMTADSLEAMIAMYWQADALAQSGLRDQAAEVYQEMLSTRGARTTRSELTRRAREWLRRFQK